MAGGRDFIVRPCSGREEAAGSWDLAVDRFFFGFGCGALGAGVGAGLDAIETLAFFFGPSSTGSCRPPPISTSTLERSGLLRVSQEGTGWLAKADGIGKG